MKGTMTITRLTRLTLAAVVVCGVSCKGGGGGGGDDKHTDTAAVKADKPAAPRSAREALQPWRSLLDEAARAELREGGLLVDFGGADQHKYTRGGWSTGWAHIVVDDGPSRCRATAGVARLDVVLDEPAARIVMAARSDLEGQRVIVSAGGKKLGEAAIGAEWGPVTIALDGGLPAGRHELELAFAAGDKVEVRAELDWLWLARAAAGDAPAIGARVLPVDIGGEPRRSLVAPTARTYSFYLDVPSAATLVFDIAAEGEATFAVTMRTDGAEPREVLREAATGKWREHAIDLAGVAGKTVRLDLTTTGTATRAGWGEPELLIDAPAPKPTAPAANKPARSAVVILIDTVRADSFEPYGSGDVHTPAYDAFASKATVFSNAYDNENWTKPSVATLLSGMYPSTHDAKRDESKLPEEVELLSQHLGAAGFSTAGFVANGYISEHFGFERGWSHFRNYIREGEDSQAESVYGDALAWLREHKDERFLLYIQTIDPHVDCEVDAAYYSRYFEGDYDGPLGDVIDAMDQRKLSSGKLEASERDLAWLRALYHGEVTYHDEHMGAFLDELDALGIADTTLVAITNDHGEELGDHGKFGHGHNLYDYMVRAPLTIRYAPAFPPQRVDEIVEHVDFAPTLVDVLGVDPMAKADGTSLLELVRGQDVRRPSYAIVEMLHGRRAVRVGSWKLVRSAEEDWVRLFDLSTDPGEKTEVAAEHPIAFRAAEVYLGEGLGMPVKRERVRDVAARRSFKATKAKISPAARRGLEALGYFGDH